MNWFAKARSFLSATMDEMSKCTWPTREHLLESTLLVIAALALTTFFVFIVDQILLRVIEFIISF